MFFSRKKKIFFLAKKKTFFLAEKKISFLARIESGRPLGQPGGGLNFETLGGQPGWSIGLSTWLAGAAAPTLECWAYTNQLKLS